MDFTKLIQRRDEAVKKAREDFKKDIFNMAQGLIGKKVRIVNYATGFECITVVKEVVPSTGYMFEITADDEYGRIYISETMKITEI